MLHRLFKIILTVAAVVLLIAAGGIFFLFWRSQPQYSGRVAMPGLTAPVDVFRDQFGVPHIFADTMNDAARALGYIHADERLFQMEMQRRAGAGRLSEVLGPDMLDVDLFIRTLGLYRLAEDSYKTLSPEGQAFFDAYTDGVNAWLKTHRYSLPPEFFLLGFSPEPWTPADSLVWGKLMALQLSENYKHEILRARLAKKLSPAQMNLLFPPVPADAPVTTMPGLTQKGELQNAPADRSNAPPAKTTDLPTQAQVFASSPQAGRSLILAALDKLGTITGLGHAASNEWAIAGGLTESGKPILANDPHLGLEAPVLWYLARIKTPELDLEGATVPGLPVVLLGQNGHIAWGFTTTGSDVQDLFVESVDPNNPGRYMTPDGAKPFETRHEVIHVKDAPDVPLTVRATRHGPVLSDIDPELANMAGPGMAVALAFTALATGDATPEALMRIDRASNWQEFLAALRLYKAPPQNIAYADRDGHIGFVAAGDVPIRRQGSGLVPAAGDSSQSDWTGTIPFEDWPQLYDPKAGFVFNANNAIVPPDSKYFYGADWEEPFRAERLQQFFDTTGRFNLDISASMQADYVDLAAQQLLPYLLQQNFSDPGAQQAFEMLRRWDGFMDADRPEPLIFAAWIDELHKLLLTDKAGDPLKAEGPYDAAAMLSILANPGDWCGAAHCDDIVKQAFADALVRLARRDGEDMTRWRWGKEHVTMLRHKFWSHVPLMSALTEIDMPSNGDFYTLDRGGSSVIDPDHPFARTHGGGFRGIYDLADPSKSRFMIATGESGHVLTRHYGDLAEAWNDVRAFTLTGTEEELKAQGAEELVFGPEPKP